MFTEFCNVRTCLWNYTGKESQEFQSIHCGCVVQYCEMEPEFLRCIGDRVLQKYDNLVASQILQRRKIRVIEGNAKCRHPKKLVCKGTLRPVFICLRPRTPKDPPPYTLYITFIRYTYSHREGGREESWTQGCESRRQTFSSITRTTFREI